MFYFCFFLPVQPQTLDFIFTDAKPLQESKALLLKNPNIDTFSKFQCVSDHLGLESAIELELASRTERY